MGDDHMHAHGHDHHHHEEDMPAMSEKEKRKAMLQYLLGHNEHHGEEIREIAEALAKDGDAEAAELLRAASDCFQAGCEKIKKALTSI